PMCSPASTIFRSGFGRLGAAGGGMAGAGDGAAGIDMVVGAEATARCWGGAIQARRSSCWDIGSRLTRGLFSVWLRAPVGHAGGTAVRQCRAVQALLAAERSPLVSLWKSLLGLGIAAMLLVAAPLFDRLVDDRVLVGVADAAPMDSAGITHPVVG